jgi:hypothetical protein
MGFAIVALEHRHFTSMIYGFAFPFGVLAVTLAELAKKVKSAEELSRPQTLNL